MAKPKPEPRENLEPFLKSLFLFAGVDEERVARLAKEVELVALNEGDLLYPQGAPADAFFIVYDGRLRLTSGNGRARRDWDTLVVGDFLGEDLLLERRRGDTAFALAPSRVLMLEKGLFLNLLQEHPLLEELIRVTAESRRLMRQENMKWLGEDEAVYIIARKHDFFLIVRLLIPIFLGLLSIPAMVFGFASEGLSLGVIGIALVVLAIFLAVWFWADWRNDYYIVTNQRVLWFEKVILLYDSRQEAPLKMVLSKNIVFNQVLHSVIDYGTLIVRTFTGSIVMHRANKPNLLATYIDGLQARSREMAKRAESEKMEDLIRERLNLPPKKRFLVNRSGMVAAPRPVERPTGISGWFANFLKVRYELGQTITYRKHYLILLQKTILPSLAFIAALSALIFFGTSGLMSWLIVFFLALLILTPISLWWLYHFVDWRNDVYVLTLENILDIDRKPLSREEKRSASLDNILSLEHTRVGILGLLFNFGTVIINVGTEQFTFDNVYNPAQVQFEIFDRMYALRQRKEEADADKERRRVVDWLSAYHKQVDTLEKIENESDWDIFPG